MKKIKLLFAALLSMMAWTGVMAADPDVSLYEAAKAAVTDGNYRITTEVSGTKYYVTESGGLTSNKAEGFIFAISQTSGGNFGTGFRIDTGSKRFTNPPLNGSVANLTSGVFATTTNDRADWERQIFYLDNGKFAIRSCNTSYGESSWQDCGRTYWTYKVDPVAPQYSYEPAFVWNFEAVLATIKVTYELYEGETMVASATVVQDANSEVAIPSSLRGIDYNGFFHEKFYYDYAASGTIGDTDCTITVTRTEKAGLVKALTDLSNNKAYYIGCDRGAMIAYDGKMVNTALNNATVNAQPLGKFAILNYENNYYIFSVDENKFIKNDASVALDLTEAGFGTADAMVMTLQTAPYFLWRFNADGKYLNTNGNQPLGYVINSWSTADQGNQYYMVEAADFDPTAALAELDAYFHPANTVTYVVKDEFGKTIFTSEPQPVKAGATITTLLDEFKQPFYTYNEVNKKIEDLETTVEFTATWGGPFKLSADFENAQWQNMAMRGTWYVTSAVVDGDGAYKTQNANTMGLVEDSYQWAFIGDGYNGFKIINKAEGEGKSFGWTDATKTNAGIPTIMDDAEGYHAWKIVASTNGDVPANSFCLNVPGTDLYINQYGGAGGSVKFWDSGNNIGDPGSAFTVFDVPDNFASFVVDEIAPYFAETDAKYFVWTDEAKASIGWDDVYKTECSFEEYKNMKEALAAALNDINNFVLPETGYYRIKSAYYDGRYMSFANGQIATVVNPDEDVTNIVKLTALGEGKYTVTVGGLSATSPTQSQNVTLAKEGAEFTAVVTAPGVGTFTTGGNYEALHCAASSSPAYYVVGWTADASASQWIIEDATIDGIDATITDAGFATLNALWPVEIPAGVKAYVGVLNQPKTELALTELSGTIPAATPVVLEGAAGTYTFNFADDVDALDNDLKGTYEAAKPEGALTLQVIDDVLGFYTFNGDAIAANKAYLTLPTSAGVKIAFPNTTGIQKLQLAGENIIYNLAGQRVNNAQKGVYIVSGKKVVK